MTPVFCGLIATTLRRLAAVTLKEVLTVDQHQSNGLYAIHQLRVRVPGDPTVYRLVVAPEEAPLNVGTLPIDQHFCDSILAGIGDDLLKGTPDGTPRERR